MKVMKFGGSVLRTHEDIERAVELIKADSDEKVVVVSALNGITDEINAFLDTLDRGGAQPRVAADRIREHHFSVLTDTGYEGAVCIEVEDRAFEGSLETRKQSLKIARDVLRPFFGK